MAALKDRFPGMLPLYRVSGGDDEPGSLEAEYHYAVSSLRRWLVLGYLVGLAVAVTSGLLHIGSGTRSWTLFVIDLLVYTAAFGALGVIAYREISRSWLEREEALERSSDELEVRFLERTAELQEANSLLQLETMERRRAEAAREASEIHFKTLIENVGDLILLVDGLGTLQYISPSVERMLGYRPERELDRNIVEFLHPEDLGLVMEQFRFGMENPGLAVRVRCRVRSSDGSWRYLDCEGKNLTEDPIVASVVVTARDVTERKESEEQIRVLNTELRGKVAELRNVNSELESFSYSVSHDLRAPLRAIRGFSEMVATDYAGSLDAEGRRLLEMIHANSTQMDRLIESLLDFSRMGRAELRRGEVEMSGLAREVARQMDSFNGDRSIEFRVGDMPPAEGDAALLRQVFVNLVSNSVKFTREKDPAVVEIGGHSHDGERVYFVSDNGVGFDQGHAEKMFGVFQRLHSPEEYEGSGVGLALVRKIVHRHGGRVWAEGAPGRGATVYFTIPSSSGIRADPGT